MNINTNQITECIQYNKQFIRVHACKMTPQIVKRSITAPAFEVSLTYMSKFSNMSFIYPVIKYAEQLISYSYFQMYMTSLIKIGMSICITI